MSKSQCQCQCQWQAAKFNAHIIICLAHHTIGLLICQMQIRFYLSSRERDTFVDSCKAMPCRKTHRRSFFSGWHRATCRYVHTYVHLWVLSCGYLRLFSAFRRLHYLRHFAASFSAARDIFVSTFSQFHSVSFPKVCSSPPPTKKTCIWRYIRGNYKFSVGGKTSLNKYWIFYKLAIPLL